MDRRSLSSLKKLLRTRDHAAIGQGVELAVSLGDPGVVDALLDGVFYDPAAPVEITFGWRSQVLKGVGKLRPNAVFSDNTREQPWLEQALLALISRAPGPRAAALREQITVVILDAGNTHAPVVDLTVLEKLFRLHTLGVAAQQGIVGGASLGSLLGLRELRLLADERASIDRLDGLSNAAQLERVYLQGCVADSSGLAGCTARRLALRDGGCRDLTPVGRMPRLRELELDVDADYAGLSGSPVRSLRMHGPPRTFAGVGELPNLEERHARGTLEGLIAPALQTLTGDSLRGAPPLPQLRDAWVGALEDDAVPAFAGLPSLETLHVCDLALPRWADLARLPALRSLTYGWATHLVSTEGVPPIDVKRASTDGVTWIDPTNREHPMARLRAGGEGRARPDLDPTRAENPGRADTSRAFARIAPAPECARARRARAGEPRRVGPPQRLDRRLLARGHRPARDAAGAAHPEAGPLPPAPARPAPEAADHPPRALRHGERHRSREPRGAPHARAGARAKDDGRERLPARLRHDT